MPGTLTPGKLRKCQRTTGPGFLEGCVTFTQNVAQSARLPQGGGCWEGPRRAGRSHETLSASSWHLVPDEVCVRTGSDMGVFPERAGSEKKGDLRHA